MSLSRGKAASFAMGFALVMTAVVARERVVTALPHAAVVFASLGVPVNLDRLEIGPVQATLRQENDLRTLLVESEVANPHAVAAALPLLRFSIRDAKGNTLYTWTASAGVKTLAAGGRVPVRARLTAPPSGADVVVEFARV